MREKEKNVRESLQQIKAKILKEKLPAELNWIQYLGWNVEADFLTENV